MQLQIRRVNIWLSLSVCVLLSVLNRAESDEPHQRGHATNSADWPMYNHDVVGWRFNSAEKTLGPNTVGKLVEKWSFPAAGSKETIGVVHATPTVVAGEVYFGTATLPAFYKLASDGSLRWVYKNNVRRALLPPSDGGPSNDKLRNAAEGGIFSSALVADGAVYFADTGGGIGCSNNLWCKLRRLVRLGDLLGRTPCKP